MQSDYPYRYVWRNNPVRAAVCGQRCRLLAVGTMNTVLVEFENGQQMTTSRNAIRKAQEVSGE